MPPEMQSERLLFLLDYLLAERGEKALLPADKEERKKLFRALVNIRQPAPASKEFLKIQDEYLQIENRSAITIETLPEVLPNICLWRGDITKLAVDAIVNAANSALLGCFLPCHNCIDNIIHTKAGIQLRAECAQIMNGAQEESGRARITSAYNLPARHVIHTVGPMVNGRLADTHRAQLRDCYQACLELAQEHDLKSIAFCCISTGVFGFPPEEAARIALDTVLAFQKQTPAPLKIIFDVFTDRDLAIYKRLLADESKRTNQ